MNIKNFFHIRHTGEKTVVTKFLATLNSYSHGRKDGEINSTAIGEAMCYGLPIVSHTSDINNGHIECIGNAGVVVNTIDEYAAILKRLTEDKIYLSCLSERSKERFLCMYEKNAQLDKIIKIYKDVYLQCKQENIFRNLIFWRCEWHDILRKLLKYILNGGLACFSQKRK